MSKRVSDSARHDTKDDTPVIDLEIARPMKNDRLMKAEAAIASAGSLRERKKARQKKALIDAAIDLFRDNGFEKTRIEDIAAAAEVSVATVYNYFTNKPQILLEIVRKSIQQCQQATAPIVENPPADPVDAVVAIIGADIGNMDDEADKKLWRELLASMTRNEENRVEIESLRGQFRAHVRQLIRLLIDRGDLPRSIDAAAMTDIIYAIYAYRFRQLVCIQPMRTAATMKSVRRDITALLSSSAFSAKR
jgi:AcrR family transcriptional regulator